MNNDGRFQIVSEDYADFIIEYNGDLSTFDNYPPGFINYIDNRFATLHVQVELMTPNAISKFGYAAIPCLYGLQSYDHLDSAGVLKQRMDASYDLTGKGVLIGIVDTGIDYLNPVFINSDNTSRILSIWDQSIDSDTKYPMGLNYGTEYSKDEINQAINSQNPLDIVPSTDYIGHGTILAGIAGGSTSIEDDFSGVAPEVEFLIVKLKPAKEYLTNFFYIPEDAICYQENDIMMGIFYLLNYALTVNKPISICLGIGSSQGDHGGSGLLSSFISYYSNPYGTCICVPAGNESNRGHHFFGTIKPETGFDTVELNIDNNNEGFSMELYGIPPGELWVEIYAPTGEYLSRIPPSLGSQKTIQIFYYDTSIIVDNQVKEEFTAQHQLTIFRIKNPIPGIWKFLIYSADNLTTNFHVWLPIAPFISKGTYFLEPNNNTTITAPGNAERPITVTAYNPDNNTLYYYASKGNTVNNLPKPDITAAGVHVKAPTLNGQFIQSAGTSIASANAAGIAALLLEWGIVRGNIPSLNTVSIKKLFALSANRFPILEYPNEDWGYGTLDIYKILETLASEDINNSLVVQPNSIYTRFNT